MFHPARKKINLDGLSINIDKNSINRVEHTKFLGVIIHQNLSWQAHIKAISSKIAKSTGIIIKSRQFFLSNTLCTLYNSLILPYLQYCSIIWASTYSSHLQPLFRLQKKALRIITHSPPHAHTYSLFNKFSTYLIFISTKFLAFFPSHAEALGEKRKRCHPKSNYRILTSDAFLNQKPSKQTSHE